MTIVVSSVNNSNSVVSNRWSGFPQTLTKVNNKIKRIACIIFEKMRQVLGIVAGAAALLPGALALLFGGLGMCMWNPFAAREPAYVLDVDQLNTLLTATDVTDKQEHFFSILSEFCKIHDRLIGALPAEGMPHHSDDKALINCYVQKQPEVIATLKMIAKEMTNRQYKQIIENCVRENLGKQEIIQDIDRMVRYELNSDSTFIAHNWLHVNWKNNIKISICERIVKLGQDIDAARDASNRREQLPPHTRECFSTIMPFHGEYNVVTVFHDIVKMIKENPRVREFVNAQYPVPDSWTTPAIEAAKQRILTLQQQHTEDTEVRQIIRNEFGGVRFIDEYALLAQPRIEDAIENARRRAYIETNSCVLQMLEELHVVRPISFVDAA